MTVSRGIELIDMWIAGNYSDDQLPPVQNTLSEDEWPMQKLTEQAERIKALEEMHLPIGSMVVANLRDKLAKADAVILQAKAALLYYDFGNGVPQKAVLAIDAYQKGE